MDWRAVRRSSAVLTTGASNGRVRCTVIALSEASWRTCISLGGNHGSMPYPLVVGAITGVLQRFYFCHKNKSTVAPSSANCRTTPPAFSCRIALITGAVLLIHCKQTCAVSLLTSTDFCEMHREKTIRHLTIDCSAAVHCAHMSLYSYVSSASVALQLTIFMMVPLCLLRTGYQLFCLCSARYWLHRVLTTS